ncbi:hypothetical protein [Streptomyces virginiae]|uniref:hypothetical protein n=1 Tax=Streptomyces virginiae TaxID=1961 RepID=UPI0036CD66A6
MSNTYVAVADRPGPTLPSKPDPMAFAVSKTRSACSPACPYFAYTATNAVSKGSPVGFFRVIFQATAWWPDRWPAEVALGVKAVGLATVTCRPSS